jgi:hypothetical protein
MVAVPLEIQVEQPMEELPLEEAPPMVVAPLEILVEQPMEVRVLTLEEEPMELPAEQLVVRCRQHYFKI